jgi:zinc protease
MVVLIQRTTSSPTVSMRGEVLVGAVNEPADLTGLAGFTAAALIRGAGARSFQQIVAETEERACNVAAGGGLHGTGFGAKALIEDFSLVLEIVGDMLMRPAFPPHEIDKLRRQFLMGMRENEQDTQYQASRALRGLLYPAEHPYSRLASGTSETLQRISRDDMLAFHALYHPASTVLAVVGDVQPDSVLAQLEQVLGVWQNDRPAPTQDLPAVPQLHGRQRQDVPMAGKVQSDLIWSVHGPRRMDQDYYAAMIANVVLGRLGMGGRLNDNIREKQGIAYYVYSSLEADLGAGPWAALAGVNPVDVERTIEAILHEVEAFQRNGPTEQELADVRAYLTGSLVLGLETNAGIAGRLLAVERYQLGLDYVARYADIINGVTHDEIVAAARHYLSTEHFALAVAGPPMNGSAPGSAHGGARGARGARGANGGTSGDTAERNGA